MTYNWYAHTGPEIVMVNTFPGVLVDIKTFQKKHNYSTGTISYIFCLDIMNCLGVKDNSLHSRENTLGIKYFTEIFVNTPRLSIHDIMLRAVLGTFY